MRFKAISRLRENNRALVHSFPYGLRWRFILIIPSLNHSPYLYGFESTTSALIFSIFGLNTGFWRVSSWLRCCLHFISSFSNSRIRSFSSSTVAIAPAGKDCWVQHAKTLLESQTYQIQSTIDVHVYSSPFSWHFVFYDNRSGWKLMI